jgi:cytochrome b561
MLKNDNNHWGVVSRLLHWLVAFLIIGLLYVGLYMAGLPDSPSKFELYGFHKSFGIMVLGLVAIRIMWRLLTMTPDLPDKLLLSRLSAPVLYLAMLTMPISGVVMSQAGGYPISVFSLFTVPTFMDKNPDLGKLAWQVHGYAGKVFIVLICLHILAALYHQLVLKNNLLGRMIKG